MGSTSRYIYSSLDPNVDSIRLVVLEPAEDQSSPISCRVRHATFREKPKYEALSYTWGDDLHGHTIFIDGKMFMVGPNLLGALKHLRKSDEERVLWIDAICINQSDIHEKNKQLRIMPYIYTRAQVVLVWLGTPGLDLKSAILPPNLTTKAQDSTIETLWQDTFIRNKLLPPGSILLRGMCNEAYWTRLWIIQEISLARRIKICYANCSVEWKDFVKALSREPFSNSKDNVPMKLQRQLMGKYGDAHKLQTLLENHQNALCKEPRDHVYGFVGLATDCVDGFPLDYQKSLFEVWKDTVMYKNADREATRHGIMKFGNLVQRLLGGEGGIATLDEIRQDLNQRMALSPPKRESLYFSARIAGRISFLGPTYHDIIADLKKTAEWKVSIHQHIQPYFLPAAMEESDMFLEILEGIEDEDLEAIASFDRDTLWEAPETANVVPDVKVFQGERKWDEDEMASVGNDPMSDKTTQNKSEEQQLFLLDVPTHRNDSPGRMGVAPSVARAGDYILQLQGVQRALIVRKEDPILTIVGTAVLAENKDIGRVTREKQENEIKLGTPDFIFREADAIELVVDVAIAYHLLLR